MAPKIRGDPVDDETRCEPYASERDVVAFKFRCCGGWYPCRACHEELADHEAEIWGPGELDEHAVLCGACGETMTIDAYIACRHTCPFCGARFNPGCQDHWDRYFATEG